MKWYFETKYMFSFVFCVKKKKKHLTCLYFYVSTIYVHQFEVTSSHVFTFLPQSQIRQERPGHGAPGLQDCRGAEGQPVIHSHPGGLLQAGEVCMDQWHQPGTSTPITVSGSQTRSRECRQNSLTCPLCFPPSAASVLQCIDNIRCNGLMMNAFEDNSKVTVPQMIK